MPSGLHAPASVAIRFAGSAAAALARASVVQMDGHARSAPSLLPASSDENAFRHSQPLPHSSRTPSASQRSPSPSSTLTASMVLMSRAADAGSPPGTRFFAPPPLHDANANATAKRVMP